MMEARVTPRSLGLGSPSYCSSPSAGSSLTFPFGQDSGSAGAWVTSDGGCSRAAVP